MRARRGVGQIKFTELVYDGHFVAGALSRWEAGLNVPCPENLCRLLTLAETPQEREPIIDALRQQRTEVAAQMRALELIDRTLQENGITPVALLTAKSDSHSTSITPTSIEGNSQSSIEPPLTGCSATSPNFEKPAKPLSDGLPTGVSA
jgi:hypothetical protein